MPLSVCSESSQHSCLPFVASTFGSNYPLARTKEDSMATGTYNYEDFNVIFALFHPILNHCRGFGHVELSIACTLAVLQQ